MLGGDLVEELGAGDGVLHARGCDQHREEKADGVGDDVPLPAHDPFACVDALAGGVNAGGGLDALGVDHTGGRFGIPSFLLSQQLPEQAVELGEHAFLLPLREVAVDRVPVREVMREIAPLDAGPVRSTYKIASMMSRSSCSGGRPKSRALPRRSKRQAASTGSINSQRASDRSLGYGQRFGMLVMYRRGPSAPRRTATPAEARRLRRPGILG